MTPNVNPDTGIRYGIISAKSIDDWIIEEIQREGVDSNFEDALKEVETEVRKEVELGYLDEDDYEDELEARQEELGNNWYDDEPVHEFEIDGVKGRTTWLGGALLVWIFESPKVSKARLCSPCVPNCGDLDNLDPDGFECYDVPEDWRYKE